MNAPQPPTGPRSDAGKAASSANATTHGLTAKRPLWQEERERLQIVADTWRGKAFPETPVEEALIDTAATEYVRYLRCVAAEEARLRAAGHQARRQWTESRRHAVRRLAQDLPNDPASTAEALHESAFGIDWMLRRWRSLREAVAAGRCWDARQWGAALNLLGLPSDYGPAPADRSEAAELWRTGMLAFTGSEEIDLTLSRPRVRDAAGTARLLALLDEQIARLEALRPLVWEEVDAAEADAVEAAAMVDTSKEGQLRQRYRREAHRDYHKSLAALSRQRADRAKDRAREERLADACRPRREPPAWSPPGPNIDAAPPPPADAAPPSPPADAFAARPFASTSAAPPFPTADAGSPPSPAASALPLAVDAATGPRSAEAESARDRSYSPSIRVADPPRSDPMPPASPAPNAPPADARGDSRNEPPDATPSSPRNTNPDQGMRRESPAHPDPSSGRTGPRTEAHPAGPGDPSGPPPAATDRPGRGPDRR
jgi:hypothetical protein